MRAALALLLAAFLAVPAPADGAARKRTAHASSSKRKPAAHQRSRAARAAFMRQTGYPHGRKGYVVDHVIPLACGGADAPSNMQWSTIAEGKAKDKWERKGPGCRR